MSHVRPKESYNLEDVVKDNKGKMEYAYLGKSGLRVSKICLGMMSYGDKRWGEWIIEEEESLPLIKAAYDAGINFFDTADIYSNGVSEVITGKAIKKYNLPRNEIVVATKLFGTVARDWEKCIGVDKDVLEKEYHHANNNGLSRKHIFDAVDASLKRLDVDYIDLLQIHRADPHVPYEETMRALHDVVQSGKVRYIGGSSMWAWQFMEYNMVARLHGWTEFISMQNFYAASYRNEEQEMLPCCKKLGVGVIPWSPLAGGLLTRPPKEFGETSRGKQKISQAQQCDTDVAGAIEKVANRLQLPMAQVACAWVLKNPVVTAPIIGISNARSLDDALRAIHVKLSDEDIKEIEDAYTVRPNQGFS
ncbi:hypothetical protein NliqN6_5871 [Naganishia liquefaciens]|uniref:NADP-dependent oxidoreductase domain-containing protein n=1 Tax=Naganishia liquefaciens TaxID=104408 RepID=A0A8H3YH49_9TREE|nr:hypothetical protein NliqN6_5871 [Naganishia liquefaciens]